MKRLQQLTSGALLTAISLSVFVPQVFAQTAVFNPEQILSDAEMRQAESMNLKEISAFLEKKGGLGKQYDIDPNDGNIKDGASLVRDAALRYHINPKYVLALLQKESSVVETEKPTSRQLEWAAGYALCDGCRRDAPLPQKYRGLAKQIDAGAGWMDWFLTNAPNLSGYRQPGKQSIISGSPLTPANYATAALYNYTPHLHGNLLLWNIMQRWFGDDSEPVRYPDGTLVRNSKNGAVALIQGGRFRPITKKSVLLTRFRSANIVDLDATAFAALDKLKRGAPVRFADLSLVRTENGDTFLLIGASKRRISSPEAFAKIGFNPEEVEDATEIDLEEYAEGEPISDDVTFPLGELLQDNVTGGVWYAESGIKHPLWDKALLSANYSGRKISRVTPVALQLLTSGDPIRLVDGTLVKAPGNPSVYLISHGEKRAFTSEADFIGLGFRFNNVLTTSAKLLALHPTGDPIK